MLFDELRARDCGTVLAGHSGLVIVYSSRGCKQAYLGIQVFKHLQLVLCGPSSALDSLWVGRVRAARGRGRGHVSLHGG